MGITRAFRLGPAPGVVSGPSLPEYPTVVPGGALGCVSGNRRRAILFRGAPVLADRDDRSGLAIEDGCVAAARVIGTVSGHGADSFTLGDLLEQVPRDRAVAITAGGKLQRRACAPATRH